MDYLEKALGNEVYIILKNKLTYDEFNKVEEAIKIHDKKVINSLCEIFDDVSNDSNLSYAIKYVKKRFIL